MNLNFCGKESRDEGQSGEEQRSLLRRGMNEKGQVFLIAAIIIAGLVVAFILLNMVAFQKVSIFEFLLENTRTEIKMTYDNYFYGSGLTVQDLKSRTASLSELLKDKATAQGHTINFCQILFDQDDSFVLGNYLGKSCNYSVGGVSQGTLDDNTSIVIGVENPRQSTVAFCECTFNYNNTKDLFQYIKLIKDQSALIWYTGLRTAQLEIITPVPQTGLCTGFYDGACPAGYACVASVTGLSNAHTGACGTYSTKVCVGPCDPSCGSFTPDTGECIFRMTSSSNAHAQECSIGTYSITAAALADAGCGVLDCVYRTGSCSSGEKAVISLTAGTNAHVGEPGTYNNKVCCKMNPYVPITPPTGTLFTTALRDASCNAGEAAIASVSDINNAHAAAAGFYTKKLCIGATDSNCGNVLASGECAFTMSDLNNAHVGDCLAYAYPVEVSTQSCTTTCQVRDDCCRVGETELASISDATNAHIATPGFYDYHACCGLGGNLSGLTVNYRSGACDAGEATLGSMYDYNNSHAGDASAYPIKICMGVTESCGTITTGSGTCLYSMYAATNSHVGNCAAYDNDVLVDVSAGCGTLSCTIRDGCCNSDELSIVSMFDTNDSHIATGYFYPNKVCCKRG